MNAAKVVLVTVLAGGISIGTAIFGHRIAERPESGRLAPPHGGALIDSLPDFRLPDLSGREIASSAWAGKILVLNYWASWCPPCLRELPAMVRAQEALKDRGVQFVGIAIDTPEDVAAFVAEYPIGFPILIGNLEAMELSRRLGNRFQALPFTVIFDARGRLVWSRIGEVAPEELKAELDGLLGPAAALPLASSDSSSG